MPRSSKLSLPSGFPKKHTYTCLFFVDAYNMKTLCFIGCCADLEICALLGFYTAHVGSFITEVSLES